MNATTAQPDILANPPFYYVMVVWGDKYVDMLLGVTLPCLMAPGNLPAMPNRQASRFLIMTTEKDRARISSSPVFAALDATVKVQFVPAPWIEDDASRYVKASRGHQEGARLAAENGAWCVFLVPDILVSDGAMPYLLRMANEGKQAVMVPGLRVVRETIDPAIDAKRAQCAAGVLEFGARELVALGLRHVHPFDRRFDWDSPQFSRQPVICTWRVPGEDGLLLRAFHLHPILMKMNGMGSVRLLDRNTIDDEFLGLVDHPRGNGFRQYRALLAHRRAGAQRPGRSQPGERRKIEGAGVQQPEQSPAPVLFHTGDQAACRGAE